MGEIRATDQHHCVSVCVCVGGFSGPVRAGDVLHGWPEGGALPPLAVPAARAAAVDPAAAAVLSKFLTLSPVVVVVVVAAAAAAESEAGQGRRR
jgi:hypothetical protein